MAATGVLSLHLAIIVFNVAGCVLIPIGAWRRWRWVLGFWWRLAHVICMAAVAAQALLGRACFLTLWQADLSGLGAWAAETQAAAASRFWPGFPLIFVK